MNQPPFILALENVVDARSWSDEFFFGLSQEHRFVLLIIGLLGAIAIMIVVPCVLAAVYGGVQRRQHALELKQEMLDRGMSADEIAEVIKAAPVEDAASRWVEGWRAKRKQS